MAASIPIYWLEMQEDVFPKSWRCGCFFDQTEQELPTNCTGCLAQPPSWLYWPAHTARLFFIKPSLSYPQTYKGSPSVHCIKSKLKCLASKMFHYAVPITDSPVPSFLKGLQLPPQAGLFHLVTCITTWSRTQGNKQKKTLAQTEKAWFLILALSLIHWITGGQLSLVSSSVEWKL